MSDWFQSKPVSFTGRSVQTDFYDRLEFMAFYGLEQTRSREVKTQGVKVNVRFGQTEWKSFNNKNADGFGAPVREISCRHGSTKRWKIISD